MQKKVNSRDLTKKIALLAILTAMGVVLGRFIPMVNLLTSKYEFSFVAVMLAAYLTGPVGGAIVGGLIDLIGALLVPTGAYFPGFTISVVLMGIVYGIFFYKKDKIRMFPETICPAVINTCILGLLLNTLWMTILYTSKGFSGWLLYRLPQEAGLLILHIVLTPLIGKLAEALRKAGLAE